MRCAQLCEGGRLARVGCLEGHDDGFAFGAIEGLIDQVEAAASGRDAIDDAPGRATRIGAT